MLLQTALSQRKQNKNQYFPDSKFTGTTWGPPGSCRPQVGPMWAPWTLLSDLFSKKTPHNSPLRESDGVSIVRYLEKIYCVISVILKKNEIEHIVQVYHIIIRIFMLHKIRSNCYHGETQHQQLVAVVHPFLTEPGFTPPRFLHFGILVKYKL